jgi:peptide chain release factor 2
MAAPDFWNDQAKAQKVIDEMKHLKEQIEIMKELEEKQEELETMFDLLQEEEDESLYSEQVTELRSFKKRIDSFELSLMLNQPYDKNNAIIELHPGAGGTESQDWASMLLRMYTRWAEKNNFKVETLDYLPGEEAGLKSVTLLIKGPNAYGYLRAEKGVHR